MLRSSRIIGAISVLLIMLAMTTPAMALGWEEPPPEARRAAEEGLKYFAGGLSARAEDYGFADPAELSAAYLGQGMRIHELPREGLDDNSPARGPARIAVASNNWVFGVYAGGRLRAQLYVGIEKGRWIPRGFSGGGLGAQVLGAALARAEEFERSLPTRAATPKLVEYPPVYLVVLETPKGEVVFPALPEVVSEGWGLPAPGPVSGETALAAIRKVQRERIEADKRAGEPLASGAGGSYVPVSADRPSGNRPGEPPVPALAIAAALAAGVGWMAIRRIVHGHARRP